MSCGFDVVLTAGTDSTLTFVKNLPPGDARVYVDLEGKPFTHDAWVAQLARGKAFTTNGALLFLRIDGRAPGGWWSVSLPRRLAIPRPLRLSTPAPPGHRGRATP